MKLPTSMKLLFLVFLTWSLNIYAQCPSGSLTFTSQQQINDYAANYGSCTNVTVENLTIGFYGSPVQFSDIVDLTPLQNITKLTGHLRIWRNPLLVTTQGLHNITEIGGELSIWENSDLTTCNLSSVTKIDSIIDIHQNHSLTDINLNSLHTLGNYIIINTNDAIQNVDKFSSLTTINGDLHIANNSSLQNLNGFQNVTSINGALIINNNASITDIFGIQNINPTSINGSNGLIITNNANLQFCKVPNLCTYLSGTGARTISGNLANCANETIVTAVCATSCAIGDFYFLNQQDIDDFGVMYAHCTNIALNSVIIKGADITSLAPLSNITEINGNLTIEGNSSLTNLNGLQNISKVGWHLNIWHNPNLTNVDALSNVTEVVGQFFILNNPNLSDFDGLNNVTEIGQHLLVINNSQLTNFNWLNSLTSVGGNVEIGLNSGLTSLSGLNGITEINGYLNIAYNNALTDLDALSNLTKIGGYLQLLHNSNVTNVNGLSSVTEIGGYLQISENSSLTDISGLQNIDPNTITGPTGLVITDNTNLSVCKLSNICTYLAGTGARTISGNLANCLDEAALLMACTPRPFITTWKTDNPGSSNSTSITIPTFAGETYNYDVSWKNDGVWETGFTGDATYDYGTAGTYTVAIRGDFPRIYFNNRGDRYKILSIEQWGTQEWTSMEYAFAGCINLQGNAIDVPDLSNVTNMNGMFWDASSFDQNIGNWNVSNVTYMERMFRNASSFDQNIGNWNVSNVTTMAYMFANASAFNQNIGGWDVSNVTRMNGMFQDATVFNGDIGAWNVSNVTYMNNMFYGASAFNGDIGAWDVSNVTTMAFMFSNASAFNQNIGNWDVSNVKNMNGMFRDASSFDQNIGNWNVSNVTNMAYMFANASAFNQNLGSWNVSKVTNMTYMFANASAFNQNIGNWDVSNVTTMSKMFYNATAFNKNIGGWDVSNVTTLNEIFFGASSFDQNLGSWNVSKVTNMERMFRDASSFNRDISGWDVSNVTRMNGMFRDASSFDQNIGNWDVSNVTHMNNMFNGVTLSTANYDALLQGWSSRTLNNGVNFHAGNSTYCDQTARDILTSTFGWTITDGGRDCSDACDSVTEYTLGAWSNGFPDSTKKVIFTEDFTTSPGNNIEACYIEINAGATLTVSEGTTIRAEHAIDIQGDLVFLSSTNGDGELAAMGMNATITGDATVHRYMKDRRSYRMVSSAVTTTTSIHDNWQEGATSRSDNPNPSYGTHITGSKIDQEHGFDGTQTGNASMYTVDVATQTFQAIANTDVNTLTAGDAYLMFIRGDRTLSNIDTPDGHTATTLRARGQLVTGNHTQTFPTTVAGQFVMFGNPYQSAVDINDVFANSVNVNTNQYYVYDVNIGDYGNYVTVNLPAGTNPSGSSANQYLQAGQAAQFATLSNGPTALNFMESAKAPGNYTSNNASANGLMSGDILNIQLYTAKNFSEGGSVHDGMAILFDAQYSNSITATDAPKAFGFGENIARDHNGTYLSIERREMPVAGEVYSLYTAGYNHQKYVFKIDLEGVTDVMLYLDDNYTGTSTLLQAGVNTYSFEVSDALSQASDRFSIRTESLLNVDDPTSFAGVRLYPNPLNAETFYVHAPLLEGKTVAIKIVDLTGRKIFNQELKIVNQKVMIKLSGEMKSGIYPVILTTEGKSQTLRLIRE